MSFENIQPNEKEKELDTEINKEIYKLKYYLEQADDLIEEDYKEIEMVSKRSQAILDKIYYLVSSMREIKVDRGEYTSRAIRQWKKSVKETYSPWVSELSKLQDVLAKRKDEITWEETIKKCDAIEKKRNSTVCIL